MNRIKELIYRNLNGKKVLWLFIVTNLVYAVMLLITIPKVISHSNGMELLDMKPLGYNSIYIFSLFESLGETGRNLYLYMQIPVDLIYPFLFGISYCLLMAYFLKKINKLNSNYFYLCLLPIIGGVADYFENFGIISLLVSYPDLTNFTMSITNIFSLIKSMTTSLFFVSLFVTIIVFGIQILIRKKTNVNIDNG